MTNAEGFSPPRGLGNARRPELAVRKVHGDSVCGNAMRRCAGARRANASRSVHAATAKPGHHELRMVGSIDRVFDRHACYEHPRTAARGRAELRIASEQVDDG